MKKEGVEGKANGSAETFMVKWGVGNAAMNKSPILAPFWFCLFV